MSGAEPGDVRKALLFALAGFATLATGDVVVKSMAGEWPGSAVASLRWLIGAAALTAITSARHGAGAVRMPRPWLQAGRGAAVAIASLSFFLGIHLMPLADAMAIVFTSPMLTALVSALVLRERVPRAAWVSIALAFAGVLVVLRPNVLALGPVALLPLVAAVGMTVLFLLNRRVAGLAPPIAMQLYLAVWAAPVLLAVAVAGHLSGVLPVPVPDAMIVLKVAMVALLATTGHLFIYRATEFASAATIAPMTYVQMLIAIGAGWLLFGDEPTAATLVGAGLIIGGGLYLWRSQSSPPPILAETTPE
jgi:drug/metabolite transporter (DMT)-like permease